MVVPVQWSQPVELPQQDAGPVERHQRHASSRASRSTTSAAAPRPSIPQTSRSRASSAASAEERTDDLAWMPVFDNSLWKRPVRLWRSMNEEGLQFAVSMSGTPVQAAAAASEHNRGNKHQPHSPARVSTVPKEPRKPAAARPRNSMPGRQASARTVAVGSHPASTRVSRDCATQTEEHAQSSVSFSQLLLGSKTLQTLAQDTIDKDHTLAQACNDVAASVELQLAALDEELAAGTLADGTMDVEFNSLSANFRDKRLRTTPCRHTAMVNLFTKGGDGLLHDASSETDSTITVSPRRPSDLLSMSLPVDGEDVAAEKAEEGEEKQQQQQQQQEEELGVDIGFGADLGALSASAAQSPSGESGQMGFSTTSVQQQAAPIPTPTAAAAAAGIPAPGGESREPAPCIPAPAPEPPQSALPPDPADEAVIAALAAGTCVMGPSGPVPAPPRVVQQRQAAADAAATHAQLTATQSLLNQAADDGCSRGSASPDAASQAAASRPASRAALRGRQGTTAAVQQRRRRGSTKRGVDWRTSSSARTPPGEAPQPWDDRLRLPRTSTSGTPLPETASASEATTESPARSNAPCELCAAAKATRENLESALSQLLSQQRRAKAEAAVTFELLRAREDELVSVRNQLSAGRQRVKQLLAQRTKDAETTTVEIESLRELLAAAREEAEEARQQRDELASMHAAVAQAAGRRRTATHDRRSTLGEQTAEQIARIRMKRKEDQQAARKQVRVACSRAVTRALVGLYEKRLMAHFDFDGAQRMRADSKSSSSPPIDRLSVSPLQRRRRSTTPTPEPRAAYAAGAAVIDVQTIPAGSGWLSKLAHAMLQNVGGRCKHTLERLVSSQGRLAALTADPPVSSAEFHAQHTTILVDSRQTAVDDLQGIADTCATWARECYVGAWQRSVTDGTQTEVSGELGQPASPKRERPRSASAHSPASGGGGGGVGNTRFLRLHRAVWGGFEKIHRFRIRLSPSAIKDPLAKVSRAADALPEELDQALDKDIAFMSRFLDEYLGMGSGLRQTSMRLGSAERRSQSVALGSSTDGFARSQPVFSESNRRQSMEQWQRAMGQRWEDKHQKLRQAERAKWSHTLEPSPGRQAGFSAARLDNPLLRRLSEVGLLPTVDSVAPLPMVRRATLHTEHRPSVEDAEAGAAATAAEPEEEGGWDAGSVPAGLPRPDVGSSPAAGPIDDIPRELSVADSGSEAVPHGISLVIDQAEESAPLRRSGSASTEGCAAADQTVPRDDEVRSGLV